MHISFQTIQPDTCVGKAEVDIDEEDFPDQASQDSADSHKQTVVSEQPQVTESLVTDVYRYCPQYLAQARRYGLTPVEAEDVVHEAFISLLKYARTTPIAHPKAFMRTVVYHKILAFLRQHRPTTLPLDDLVETSSADLPLAVRTHLTVDFQAFAHAHPEQALALELWASGCTEHELARSLGRTPHAVRQYLLECRKKLRTFYKDA